MEGGIRMDPVKGKLATLEILTHNAITPKNNIGVEYSYKKPTPMRGCTKSTLKTHIRSTKTVYAQPILNI
jgi:hypothetical protein